MRFQLIRTTGYSLSLGFMRLYDGSFVYATIFNRALYIRLPWFSLGAPKYD